MLRALLVFAVLSACASNPARADSKADVTDPVLQEIISSFSTKMPRFVNKHGAAVFVADEPLTRGSLMHALYEYDKSIKLPRDMITRKEFDELRSRLSLVERGGVASSRQSESTIDIAQLINALQPNLPILLDNTLDKSKLFNELKATVAQGPGPSAGSPGVDLRETRSEMAALERRLNTLEKKQIDALPRDTVAKQEFAGVQNKLLLLETSLEEMRRKGDDPGLKTAFTRLEQRMLEVERSPQSTSSSRTAGDPVLRRDLDLLQGKLTLLEAELKKNPGSDRGVQVALANLGKRISQMERGPGTAATGSSQTNSTAMSREIDAIRGKLAILENDLASAKTDESQVMMKVTMAIPGLVEKSLGQSKAFDALKDDLLRQQGSSGGANRLRMDLARLEKRMDELGRSRVSRPVPGAQVSASADASLRTDLEALQEKIARLEKDDRLNRKVEQSRNDLAKLEKKVVSLERSPSYRSDKSSGGIVASTTMLTKVSFGLSMVAALLIAR